MIGVLIVILLGVVGYLFFSRSSDTKTLGQLDPNAISVRRSLLRTTDERVHEQFAMLYAAAMVMAALTQPATFPRLQTMSPEKQEAWIRSRLDEWLVAQGFGPTFLRSKLTRYVYELYRPVFITQKDIMGVELTESASVGLEICREGATYLDAQFEREGLADVCAFLKGE